MKIRIIVAKRLSKKTNNSYLSCSFKVGDFARSDYFFISANNVMALTGMSLIDLQNAKVGVLFDKDIEVK